MQFEGVVSLLPVPTRMMVVPGTCVVPCQSDLECGNPEEYTFYSCIQNQCIYVGCQTDKECQLYLGGGAQPGGKHQQIVCRDKAAK